MENMNTQINTTHMEHPEDERILDLLKNFTETSKNGFLRLVNADRVFVIVDSEAHQKIKALDGQALPLGETEVGGFRFAEYSVNESFFKP
jgi:hypothetical protein